jgi:hypothetical protein
MDRVFGFLSLVYGREGGTLFAFSMKINATLPLPLAERSMEKN